MRTPKILAALPLIATTASGCADNRCDDACEESLQEIWAASFTTLNGNADQTNQLVHLMNGGQSASEMWGAIHDKRLRAKDLDNDTAGRTGAGSIILNKDMVDDVTEDRIELREALKGGSQTDHYLVMHPSLTCNLDAMTARDSLVESLGNATGWHVGIGTDINLNGEIARHSFYSMHDENDRCTSPATICDENGLIIEEIDADSTDDLHQELAARGEDYNFTCKDLPE